VPLQRLFTFHMDPTVLNAITNILECVPLHTILTETLDQSDLKTSTTHAAIVHNTAAIACVLVKNPAMQSAMQEVAFGAYKQSLITEVAMMARRKNRWHFKAQKVCPEQIEGFSIVDMSRELKMQASDVTAQLKNH
jgi:hypothetical protein